MALPREAPNARSAFDRPGRTRVIVPHPAADARPEADEARDGADTPVSIVVLESRLRDEARLEGVHLAAREMAHVLNNKLAVVVGLVDLLEAEGRLPPDLFELLRSASHSLDAATRHIEQMQHVVRVVVKDTPAGKSLDLEQSQPSAGSSQRTVD